jgi:hypothetical protein
MEQAIERLIRIATRILKSGNPLPVDLEAKMDDLGIDMSEVRRKAGV